MALKLLKTFVLDYLPQKVITDRDTCFSYKMILVNTLYPMT